MIKSNRPFIIPITGGSASGKTTVAQAIIAQLRDAHFSVESLCADEFYLPYRPSLVEPTPADHDFDSPAAFNKSRLRETIYTIISGKSISVPRYDYIMHAVIEDNRVIPANIDVLIIEGIMLFDLEIDDLIDYSIYVKTDVDTMLARRTLRGLKEWGRSAEELIAQYLRWVKPNFDRYMGERYERKADLVINNTHRAFDKNKNIEVIVRFVIGKLTVRLVD